MRCVSFSSTGTAPPREASPNDDVRQSSESIDTDTLGNKNESIDTDTRGNKKYFNIQWSTLATLDNAQPRSAINQSKSTFKFKEAPRKFS